MITRWVILVCWVTFLLYWFISAASVKSTRETRGWLGGNWFPISLAIGFLFIGDFKLLARFGIPTKLLGTVVISHNSVFDVVGIVLLVAGLVVSIAARRTLAGNWSAVVALKNDHELITTGLYQYVRHPIYLGILLMILGTVLTLDTMGSWIGFLMIVLSILVKLHQEELLLTEYFAEQYSSYKKHTKTLIPFIW